MLKKSFDPGRDLLRSAMGVAASVKVLDGAATPDTGALAARSADYAAQNIRLQAGAAVQQWVEDGDRDDGEGAADRLLAMMVGIADADKDGELSGDEQAVVQLAMNAAWEYMAAKGILESDLEALFNSDDPEVANAAGARAIEYLADTLPDGEDASLDELDAFAFDDSALEPALDAVYRARFAIRDGKKVKVKQRIAGAVRLSAKQKLSIRKMLARSHSAGANARRMKSARIGRQFGLHGK